MNKLEAKNLVLNTFEKSFDESRFTYFVRNLLNNLDESKSQTWAGSYIPESFRNAIKSYKRIGQYTAKDNNVLDILIVNIKREITLERARTLQRNFIARHLKQRNHEAALVAFYTEGYDDWRFSLVKMDFNLSAVASAKAGINKSKVEIELSPAKRYSFLVGENERSHTAQSQFQKILTEIPNPSLNDLEQAFNIETVTREFFLEYRNLFIHTKLELDKVLKDDPKLKLEFESKNVNSVDFSKKLLGQIIFLYFLQKKGWFGVERDSDWGTGSKKFLRELLDKKHGDYKNFFNDILEPLFYDALRYPRVDIDHYYPKFNCKIPFLNGGLFDPINNYDWVHTDIILPNDLFSNKNKTSQCDIGDGIFDIFDRYNFTVIEDEPLEKEVAIDPELLGKAYERFNAIRPDNFNEYIEVLKSGKKGEENKFNKQYGVYYTPREIVHYMCRESLINYLASEFSDKTDSYQKVSTEQLDAFGNTTRKGQLALESEYKPNPYIPKEDIETLINYGELLGENEAVVESKGKETETYYHKLPASIRKNAKLIDEKLSDILICDPAVGSGAFPVGMMHEIVGARNLLSIFIKERGRTIYNFKRESIERSLYGVDIDSGAVEIAKLRLWLSLVVDEDNINNIKPLPNLDYKILRGDSLLGFPVGTVKNTKLENEIESLKQQYFNSKDVTEKRELNKSISLKFSELLEEAKQFSDKANNIIFDFEIFFSEVFHNKSKKGFDIFIGNPPYGVSIKNEYRKIVLSLLPKVPDYEIFYFFIEVAYKYLKQNGIVTYIIPNTILFNVFAAKYRLKLLEIWHIVEILDCTDFDLFESVTVRNAIIRFLKTNNSQIIGYKTTASASNFVELSSRKLIRVTKNVLIQNNTNWALIFKLDTKILSLTKKIRENKNPLNSSYEVSQGYIPYRRSDLVNTYGKIKGNAIVDKKLWHSNKRINKQYKQEIDGECISKYSYTTIESYVKYGKHLACYVDLKFFNSPRLLVREITNPNIIACYIEKEFVNDPQIISIISKSNEKCELMYLWSILNSRLATFYHFNSSPKATKGAFPKILVKDLNEFPVVEINDSTKIYFEKLADLASTVLKKFNKTINNIMHLENQIDIIVYKLYNLTYEEVKIIDPEIEKIISEKDYDKT